MQIWQVDTAVLVLAVAKFRDTGLERSRRLSKDIAWFKDEYSLEPAPALEDGPGRNYSRQGNLVSNGKNGL